MSLSKSCFLYVRVSTMDQIGGAESQTRSLIDWCEKNNIKNYEIFTDHGISGAKESRPALNRMMEKMEAGLCEQVVVFQFIGCLLPYGVAFLNLSPFLNYETVNTTKVRACKLSESVSIVITNKYFIISPSQNLNTRELNCLKHS